MIKEYQVGWQGGFERLVLTIEPQPMSRWLFSWYRNPGREDHDNQCGKDGGDDGDIDDDDDGDKHNDDDKDIDHIE